MDVVKNAPKKRQRIRNLTSEEFEGLFPPDDMVDFENIKTDKTSLLIDLLKGDTAQNASRWILALLAVAGVVTIAAVAPNFFILFKGSRKKYCKKISRETYNGCIKNLKQYDYVNFEVTKDGLITLSLTKKGEEKAKEIKFNSIKIEKPKKWDRKWRMVMFDIPEKHKSAREALRWKLKELGFYKFQDSAFIYPYECFKEIDLICRIFSITSHVRCLIVEEFYYDKQIKEFFKL